MVRSDFKKAVPVIAQGRGVASGFDEEHFELGLALYQSAEFAAFRPGVREVVVLRDLGASASLPGLLNQDWPRAGSIAESEKVLESSSRELRGPVAGRASSGSVEAS